MTERTANIVAAVCVAIIFFAIAFADGWLLLKVQPDNERRDETQRYVAFKSCVENGNIFRKQVRDEFVDLKADVLLPLVAGVASVTPPEAPVREILDDTTTKLRTRIATINTRIPNVDCLAVWPPLEGQEYPESLVREAQKLANDHAKPRLPEETQEILQDAQSSLTDPVLARAEGNPFVVPATLASAPADSSRSFPTFVSPLSGGRGSGNSDSDGSQGSPPSGDGNGSTVTVPVPPPLDPPAVPIPPLPPAADPVFGGVCALVDSLLPICSSSGS
jgi:hypothetical protein